MKPNAARGFALISLLLAALPATPASPAAAAERIPVQVVAEYKFYKSGILIGTVSERFSRDGDKYRIVSDTQTAGALGLFLRDRVTMTSEGAIGPQGMKPDLYEFTRAGNHGKDIRADFDWPGGRITSRHEGKTESFDLPAGTLDRISAMYQFMFVPPTGDEVAMWMSAGKKAERYYYVKQDEPTLSVGGSPTPTVHYARAIKAGESRAELWLAKDLHYLPVRIIFEDSHGLSLEQSLVSLHAD